jgi:uncharacterized membrane protein
MSFSGSFSLDLVIIFVLLMALTAGIGQIAWGSYKHGQAFSRPPGKPPRDHLRLWQQLLKWQVVPPSYIAPPELEEFACARDFIQSSAIIGGGLAIVLASLGSTAISLAATGSLLNLLAGTGYFFGTTLLFASLIGSSLGYGYGVWQLRRLTARTIAYGDLHPRKLADYRSALLPWIAGALIVYAFLIPLLLTSFLGARISLSPFTSSLDAPTWILEAIPAAMLVALVAGEVVMTHIAKLPRLLLLSNPQTAQRADSLLRALTIGSLQGLELGAIGYLGVAQGAILQQYFGRLSVTPQGWAPYALLYTPALVFPWAVGLIGLLLPALAGRLGGKISGWPWQPMRVP